MPAEAQSELYQHEPGAAAEVEQPREQARGDVRLQQLRQWRARAEQRGREERDQGIALRGQIDHGRKCICLRS